MPFWFFGLLLGGILLQPAAAQVTPAPKDTIAARVQLPGADCALFPAVARLPAWILENKLPPSRRFTPTASQAAAVEQALATAQLLQVNSTPNTHQDSTYARNITQQLGQYHRQYFGFYNRRKQPCLLINFLGSVIFSAEDLGLRPKPPGYIPQWLRAYLFIGDGGAEHWSIHYNLTTGKFYQYWHSLDLGGG